MVDGVFFAGLLPNMASANKPVKTTSAPTHCLEDSALPKNNTEHKTVKNFRVVVTTEQANGPYVETWKKNKIFF